MIKKAIYRTIFTLFTLGIGFPVAWAVEVENLYQVEVAVKDQSQSARWKAAVTGFKEIMVRRSGSEQVLSAHEVQKAYSKVTAYLQRFEYEAIESDDPEQVFNLVLHYEPRLIDQLIQEAGMPIWSSNRPLTIMWFVVEESLQRQVLKGNEEVQPQVEMLRSEARRRGLPVIFPLMDLEDQVNISQSDIWGRFSMPIAEASQRYAADAIIFGRIAQLGEGWEARVTYYNEGEEESLDLNESSIELLYASLTNHLAEMLCTKYCVVEQLQTNQLLMQVSNVGSFAAYKSLQKYLDGLSSVRSIEVSRIASNHVELKVSLLGELINLQEEIRLSNDLIEETAPQINPFAVKKAGEGDFINPEIAAQLKDGPLIEDSALIDGSSQIDGSSLIEEEQANANQTKTEQQEQNAEAGLELPAPVESIADNEQVSATDNTEAPPQIVYYRWQR
ncbi:DUF2066 domain-containing protein [Aliikangiella sp. G2MR2-5]|uniref:DUF2066 domain-containing protein n=1 Tax=Aliikangiella sp. G2MR2-5 TaxID=2788943 RepID=UPI0018AA207A|nr:DUF2066 domain-containing protein [Aliikangiella sp. G2MR2-5]